MQQFEEHTFRRFDEDMEKLVARVIKMGTIAQEQIKLASRALSAGNADMAQLVIDRDEKIDRYDVKIDKLCLQIFALRQPVAMDLRLIMAAMSINRNIERIGDCAVNIAEKVLLLHERTDIVKRTQLVDMCARAERMVVDAIQSFVNGDVELARAVAVGDDEVDALDRENFRILIDMMTRDAAIIEPCSHLLLVNRNIERLADEATNIAEEVVFLVDAKIVKHRNWTQSQGEATPISPSPNS